MRFVKRALLTLIALALLAIGAAAIYAVLRKPLPQLARNVPESVTYYFEVPSWKRAVTSLASMKIIDQTKVAGSQTTLEAAAAIEGAFGLSKVEALTLGATLGGVAITGRSGQALGSAVLVSVSAEAPVEALLKSSRFAAAGGLGKARLYQVTAGAEVKGALLFEKLLRALSTDGTRRRLAWFPDQHLIALGDDSLLREIADVIDHGKPSLAERDLYLRAQKRMDSGADAVSFVDEQLFRERLGPPPSEGSTDIDGKQLLDGALHDGGAMVANARFSPSGLVVNASAVLTGRLLPTEDDLVAHDPLTYPERLPAETVAYVVGVAKRGGSPAEAKSQIIKALLPRLPADADVAGQVSRLETRLGVTIEDLWKTLGDEVALAVLVDKELKLGGQRPLRDAAVSGVAVLVALKVDDDTVAKKVLAELHEQAATPDVAALASVSPDGDGFILTPTPTVAASLDGAAPLLHVRHGSKEIVIVLGPEPLSDRALAALETGQGTLRDDAGHTRARKSLRDNARLYSWIDLGRVATLAYAANPDDREDPRALGFPVDSLKLTGDDRVTAAFDLDYHATDHTWTVDVEMLNPWAFALLSGVQAPISGRGLTSLLAGGGLAFTGDGAAPTTAPVVPVPSATPLPPMLPPTTGIAACDDYLNRLESCTYNTPQLHQRYMEKAAALRKAYTLTTGRQRAKTAKACAKQLKDLLRAPACK